MHAPSVAITLAASTETGKLKIMHLKRYWSKNMLKVERKLESNAFAEEWDLDNILLSVLEVGIYQVATYFYEEKPSFEQFEDWILELNHGSLNSSKVSGFNEGLVGKEQSSEENPIYELSCDDRLFWEENGYLIIKNAVPKEDCEAAVQVICDTLGVNLLRPETWYQDHELQQGIMVQLFQHPAFQKNRESPKIRAVYEQLWGRKDIWLNTDKVGFNPPETDRYKFRGSPLHWDTSLQLPIPFGLQGILYLTDTESNQGAFTCVPGFHNKIEAWLKSLPEGCDPRTVNLAELGAKPIAAGAGDCIVWHHALPHGASANRHTLPRFVQYLNYSPINADGRTHWR